MLLRLPDELLIAIASQVNDLVGLRGLARSSARTYHIAISYYYEQLGKTNHRDPILEPTRRGNIFVVETFLKQRKDPNSRWMRRVKRGYQSHSIALLFAVENDRLEIAKLLLAHGTNPDSKCGGKLGNMLAVASHMGRSEMVKLLLHHGASPDAKSGGNGFALRAAAQAGHLETVKALLDGGANVNQSYGQSFGTALEAALNNSYAGSQHIEIAFYLLSRGADDNLRSDDDEVCGAGRAFRAALNKKGQTEILQELIVRLDGRSAAAVIYLATAARAGNASIVQLLVDQGVDIDKAGARALGVAARQGHLHILKMLVEAGTNVNSKNWTKGTALLRACIPGHKECVRYLLDHGALVNIDNGVPYISSTEWTRQLRYKTALQAACWSGHIEIVKMLLDAGADPNISGGRWFQPLNLAAYCGYIDIVRMLLDKGADPSARGRIHGDNALQAATQIGNFEIVELLLRYGARIDGSGALQTACGGRWPHVGNHKMVKLLLAHGADVNNRADGHAISGYISAGSGPGYRFSTALEVARLNSYGANDYIIRTLVDHEATE